MGTPTQTAARQVLETVPAVMRTLAAELRHTAYDMAPAHFGLMFALSKHSHNLSELAERQMVSPPTMSNSITALVDRGWVRRVRASYDRRVVLVELTPAGQAVLDDIQRQVEARMTELLGPLSPDECEQLAAGLEILRNALAQTDVDGTCSEGSAADVVMGQRLSG